MIACVFVPDLVFHVAKQMYPTEQDVLLVTPKGFVQAASRVAVRRGARMGMRVRQAHALCPEAGIHPFDDAPYQEISEEIETLLSIFTNRIEAVFGFGYVGKPKKMEHTLLPASSAVYYLDLGKLKGTDACVLALQIEEMLSSKMGLCASIGLSRGKFPGLVAARTAQPGRPSLLQPGEEAGFLASFPITLLPLDRDTSQRLDIFGIQTLGAFARFPNTAVRTQFGREGRGFHKLAQGEDDRPVIPRPRKPSESVRELLDGAVDNRVVLEALIERMSSELAERLVARSFTTQKVEILVQLENGKVLKTRRVLPGPIQERKAIARQFIRLLAQLDLPCGVVSLETQAHELAAPVMQQLDLFGQLPMINRLDELLESIAAHVGEEHVCRITELDRDHWLLKKRFLIQPLDAA